MNDSDLYYFDNEQSEKIIKKYNISKLILFDDENKTKGLQKLLKETIKQLNFYKDNDLHNFFLYLESKRFFCFLIYNQKINNLSLTNYYNSLLKYFHNNNLLLYKKQYLPYKTFKRKIPIMIIYFKFLNIAFHQKYNSFKCLENDFGRYKAEQILKLRKNKNETFMIPLDEIIKIIEDF